MPHRQLWTPSTVASESGFPLDLFFCLRSFAYKLRIHSAAPHLKIAIALLDCDFVFCARRCNVGFSCCAAHTLAVGAESRTQRRHTPHGAVQALGTSAGSIVPIFFTGGKSALSARLSEIHRLPLLRYVSARIPFSLRGYLKSQKWRTYKIKTQIHGKARAERSDKHESPSL